MVVESRISADSSSQKLVQYITMGGRFIFNGDVHRGMSLTHNQQETEHQASYGGRSYPFDPEGDLVGLSNSGFMGQPAAFDGTVTEIVCTWHNYMATQEIFIGFSTWRHNAGANLDCIAAFGMSKEVASGEKAFGSLILPEPIAVQKGDQFCAFSACEITTGVSLRNPQSITAKIVES